MTDNLYVAAILVADFCTAIVMLRIIHWIGLKLLHKERIGFRRWIKSWIAGPELYVGGLLLFFFFRYAEPHFRTPSLIGTLINYLGVVIFLIKVIASFILLLYRRFAGVRQPQAAPLEYGPHLVVSDIQHRPQYPGSVPKSGGEPESI